MASSDVLVAQSDPYEQFAEFYSATAGDVLRQVLSLTRSTAEAQDCVQEAYAKAWEHWAEVSLHPDPRAWVRRVAFRCAVSRWRRTRNRLLAHFRAHDEAHVPEPSPDTAALVAAMRTLPAAQREALALHYFADLPVDEIADLVKAPSGTVKARLSRGRAALNVLLADQVDTPRGRRSQSSEEHS